MTISYSIMGVSSSGADVTVPVIDQSHLVYDKQINADPKTNSVTHRYKDTVAGTKAHPVFVDVTIREVPAKGTFVGRRYWSITHSTWAVISDSVTGLVQYENVSRTYSGNDPLIDMEAADLRDWDGNMYGLRWSTLTSKVPDTGHISAIDQGVGRLYG